MKFIKAEDAQILWNVTDDHKYITELIVFEFGDKMRKEKFDNRGEDFYRNHLFYKIDDYFERYHLSDGACTSSWKEENKDFRLCKAFRLVVECNDKKIRKKTLIQLGKIDEFEAIRRFLWIEYPEFMEGLGFEEFQEIVYGDQRDIWNL